MKQIIIFFLLSIGISFLGLNELPSSNRQDHKVSFKQHKNTPEKFLESIDLEFQEDISDEHSGDSVEATHFLGLNPFFTSLLTPSHFLFPSRSLTIQLFKLFHNYRI
jgi:hypothetical protein